MSARMGSCNQAKLVRPMRKWILLICALSLVVLMDQSAKAWVLSNLTLYESSQPIPALAPFFQLTRSSNSGAAFGIFPLAGDALLVVALAIVAGLLWFLRSAPAESRLTPIAIGLIIGGAIGNIIDRLHLGYVIDFIHYQIPGLISNVSNLADHAIVLGAGLIIAESSWREGISRGERNSAADT